MVMPSLALEWILSKAQSFMNALLSHGYADALLPLRNSRIRFVFEPMNIAVEMTCTSHPYIVLTAETQHPVSLTLKGTPLQFLKSMTSHTMGNLHIAGDIKLAQVLQRALENLNIDVESFLSTIVGGTVAHHLISAIKKTEQKSREVASHTVQDISDYCQYEIHTITPKEECDIFTKKVNELRYKVDHLSVKIAQLKQHIEERHVPR